MKGSACEGVRCDFSTLIVTHKDVKRFTVVSRWVMTAYSKPTFNSICQGMGKLAPPISVDALQLLPSLLVNPEVHLLDQSGAQRTESAVSPP